MPHRGGPPFADAAEALAPLERASQGAGGVLAEPKWARGDDNPEPEPEPELEDDTELDQHISDDVLESEAEEHERHEVQRRTTLLRRASIGVMVVSASVAAVAGGLRLREPDDAPATTEAPLDPAVAFERLDRINDPSAAAAMPYPERIALLRSLRANSTTADLVDDDLQIALDLRQATGAPDPCRTFRAAVKAIAAEPKLYFREEVARARVPDGEGCGDLAAKLEQLRTGLGAR